MAQIITMKASYDEVIELADTLENCAEWMEDVIELLEKSHDPSFRKALARAKAAQEAIEAISEPVESLIRKARASEARWDTAVEKRREQSCVELWD